MQSVKKRKREAEKRVKAHTPKPLPCPPVSLVTRIEAACQSVGIDLDALKSLYDQRHSSVQPTLQDYDAAGSVLGMLTGLIERYDQAKAAYDAGIGNVRACDRERQQRGLAYRLDLAIDRIGLALGDGGLNRPFNGWGVKLLLELGRTGHNLRHGRIGDVEGDPLCEMEVEYEENLRAGRI